LLLNSAHSLHAPEDKGGSGGGFNDDAGGGGTGIFDKVGTNSGGMKVAHTS